MYVENIFIFDLFRFTSYLIYSKKHNEFKSNKSPKHLI